MCTQEQLDQFFEDQLECFEEAEIPIVDAVRDKTDLATAVCKAIEGHVSIIFNWRIKYIK